MASLLFRVVRTASVASSAARSGTGAAAADLSIGSALRGVPFANRRFSGLFADGSRCPIPVREPFVADEKDLESDEALWAFYERWRKHYNLDRDRDEMARRFDEFKRTVFRVHQVNNRNLPYKVEVNMFADGKLREIYGFKPDLSDLKGEKVENMPSPGKRTVFRGSQVNNRNPPYKLEVNKFADGKLRGIYGFKPDLSDLMDEKVENMPNQGSPGRYNPW